MKIWQKFVSLACACVLSIPFFAGCGATNEISKDPTTINVAMYKNSYGADWLYEIASKFEDLYADQGYRVNIMDPARDMSGQVVVQQLARGYDATQVDMYVTGGISPSDLGEEGAYYQSPGLVEELSDVWNSKPIGYDGTEESKTLKEKANPELYEEATDIYGNTYMLPYIASTGGLVVNTRKLALYGITELPKTTNELFDVWTTIYLGANGQNNSEKTGMFPFTYMPGAANGYLIDWWVCSMAQYDEKQSNEYWSWQTKNNDGTVTWWEEGVTGAVNDAFRVSAEVMAQAADINIASRGTTTQTLDQAQAKIMLQNGGAIFMSNGSWYLNDMKTSYRNSLNDITFMNYPVVSALATKLWGQQGKSEEDLETTLRAAIAYVDDLSKASDLETGATTVSAIKGVNVTAADMAEVRRARYSYAARTDSQMIIAKGSMKTEICKLFMRMIASEDAANTITEKANSTSAYTTSVNDKSQYKFVVAASKIKANNYSKGFHNRASGYRFVLGQTRNSISTGHVPAYFASLSDSKSIYDGDGGLSGETVQVYKDLVTTLISKEIKALSDNFASWKTAASGNIAKYRDLMNARS